MKTADPLVAQMRKRRLADGISIRALAKCIGVSFSTLAKLERGIGTPNPASTERIERWINTGKGSSPAKRNPAEAPWSVKIEQDFDALDERIQKLEARLK